MSSQDWVLLNIVTVLWAIVWAHMLTRHWNGMWLNIGPALVVMLLALTFGLVFGMYQLLSAG